jgi:sec-independent protein translocase protein TatB
VFDVGFSELIVIGAVALLVLGPERMPKLARDVGRWIGRARRYVNRVREEIDREVELNELRRLRDEIETKVNQAATEVEATQAGVEQVVSSPLEDVAQPRDLPPSGSTPIEPEPPAAPPHDGRAPPST